jgi:DNA-directed RNA polymerase subunit RPC12/RpoP
VCKAGPTDETYQCFHCGKKYESTQGTVNACLILTNKD